MIFIVHYKNDYFIYFLKGEFFGGLKKRNYRLLDVNALTLLDL